MSIVVGALELQMSANIAALSQNMQQAKGIVTSAVGEMQQSVEKFKGVLGTLGVGIGFGAVIAKFKAITDAAAALDDLSEKTGAAVEELSKLEQVAKIGGHSLETVEGALIRLSKGLHAGGEEAKGAGKALAALGLSADALRGKDTAEALRIVAVELNKYADGSGKTALALDLLGKSGAQALPFIKDLANEQGIATRVTTEQVAAAEELQKTIGRLRNEMGHASQATVLKLVPSVLDWIAANREALRIGGSVTEMLRLFVFNLEAMTTEKPGAQIRRLTAELERLQTVGSKPFWQQSGMDVWFGDQKQKDITKQVEFLKFLQRQEAAALGGKDTPGEMQRFGLSGAKLALNYQSTKDDAAKVKDADSAYRNLLKSLKEKLLVDKELTEVNKLQLTLDAMSAEQLATIWPARRAELMQLAAKADALKDAKVALDAYVKGMEADLALQQEIADVIAARATKEGEAIKAQHTFLQTLEFETTLVGLNTAAREKAVALRALELSGIDKESAEYERLTARIRDSIQKKADAEGIDRRAIEQLQFETKLIGLNTVEREHAIAIRALELKGVNTNTEAFKEYSDALKQGLLEKEFAESTRQQQIDLWRDVDRVAHDTFVSIFDSGKNTFERLTDTLKNTLYALLYKMAVQPILINVVTSVAGQNVAQQVFGTAAVNGQGGLGGIGNLLSTGQSVYGAATGQNPFINGITNFFGGGSSAVPAAATALGGAGTMVGGLGLTTATAGGASLLGAGASTGALLGTTTGTGLVAGAGGLGLTTATTGGVATMGAGAVGGAGAAIGAAVPIIGAIIAIAALAGMFGKKKEPPILNSSDLRLRFGADGGLLRQTGTLSDLTLGNDDGLGRQTLGGISSDYFRIIKALGGTANALDLGFGADKKGDKRNNFSLHSVSGGVVYNTGDVGYSDEGLKTAASRALFAALVGSEVPDLIRKNIFDPIISPSLAKPASSNAALEREFGITSPDLAELDKARLQKLQSALDAIDSGSIERLLSLAQALKLVYEELDKAADPVGRAADQIKSLNEALGGTTATSTEQWKAQFRYAMDNGGVGTQEVLQTWQALGETIKQRDQITRDMQAMRDEILLSQEEIKAKKITELNRELGIDVHSVDQLKIRFAALADTIKDPEVLGKWKELRDILSQSADAAGRLSEQPYLDRIQSLEGPLRAAWENEVQAQEARVAAVEQAEDALRAAHQREVADLEQSAQAWEAAAKDLRGYRDELLRTTGTIGQNYFAAQSQFLSVANRARIGGDLEAMGELPGAAEAFREASRQRSATRFDYMRDVGRILGITENVASEADKRAQDAREQIELLRTQVGALIMIDGDVVTVAQAVRNLQTAREAADQGEAQLAAYREQVAQLITLNDTSKTIAQLIAEMRAAWGGFIQMRTGQPLANPTGAGPNQWLTTVAGGSVFQSPGGAWADRVAGASDYTVHSITGATFSGTQALADINASLAANDPLSVYRAAALHGISLSTLDMMKGWAPGTAESVATGVLGLPSFAVGSASIPHDMMAVVHQGERIIPAAANDALVQELQEVKAELRWIKGATTATAANTGAAKKVQTKWDDIGVPIAAVGGA